MQPSVLLERRDHTALITFNNPSKLNPLTPQLVDEFRAHLGTVTGDGDLRCLVITGSGRGFSAGADFSTLPTLAERSGLEGPLGTHAAIEAIYGTFSAVHDLDIPTIAAVNGAAVGGGFGISLMCDIRIVAEDARMGANFARLGFHSGLAITELLPRAVGYEAAAELLFTGRLVTGTEAVAMGLARRCLPADQVLPEALELARQISAGAPLAVRWMKRSLRNVVGGRLDRTMQAESIAQALLMQSADARAGVAAALSKEVPEFEGR